MKKVFQIIKATGCNALLVASTNKTLELAQNFFSR